MSDDRRFDPTPQRREKARREGNVARSAELAGIAALGAATLAACVAVPAVAAAAVALLRAPPAPGPLAALAVAALAPAAAAALGATVAALAQGGGLRLRPLRCDLAQLAPAAGLKRMLGAEGAVGAARASLALAAALLALLPVARDVVGAAVALAAPSAAATLVARAALRAAAVALAVGAAFALADYALARRRWLAGLRMSLDDVRRETKEQEGDPHAKARRRRLHHGVLRGTLAKVREASFLVVNPVHVAVALRYAPPAVPVPTVLVRAAGEPALRAKALARAHAVPVVESPALARLLFARGEAGRPIPADTFVAVAHVVAALAREGLLA